MSFSIAGHMAKEALCSYLKKAALLIESQRGSMPLENPVNAMTVEHGLIAVNSMTSEVRLFEAAAG